MAFDDLSSESTAIASINVTPLVDVMLVLLVIFMVAAPILQQGVELELPQETIAPIEGDSEQLVISINKTGDIFIGSNNKVEVKELGKRVSAILQPKKDKSVFLKADKAALYGSVMAVMAELRRNGIVKIGLVTEPT